jgi:ferredoxin
MSHHTVKNSYLKLQERINLMPQGAPPSDTLYQILEVLFSQKEAELVAQLPIKPFTAEDASKVWKLDLLTSQKTLETLAGKALLLDLDNNGVQRYVLPPPMAGFFEFSLMRTRGDIDQKLLSELLHQYLNVEEDFIKDLFMGSETRLGRVFVNESVLSSENAVHILDFERASHTIQTASSIGIGMCYCRHKQQHLNQACDAPMDICMTFNSTAASLIKHDFARQVEVSEGMELLHQAYESNLVQCGENVRNEVSFICNCCGCCCEALVASKKYGMLHPVHTTNFLPKVNADKCIGCGKCIKVCPIEAISYAKDEHGNQLKLATINEDICLGCGVCARACPTKCIGMESRPEKVITPVNSAHRLVLMAIEKGKLQNLVFDNQALESHRAMAMILSVIAKLPPAKQIMASKQVKSVYLDKLLERIKV